MLARSEAGRVEEAGRGRGVAPAALGFSPEEEVAVRESRWGEKEDAACGSDPPTPLRLRSFPQCFPQNRRVRPWYRPCGGALGHFRSCRRTANGTATTSASNSSPSSGRW